MTPSNPWFPFQFQSQEAMGDFAEAERVYAQLKEEHPTNAVRGLLAGLRACGAIGVGV